MDRQIDSLQTSKKFKKTEIGEIPVDWEVNDIDELCTLGRGRVISQNEIDNNPGPYPVYSSQSKDKGIMGSIKSYDFEGEYVTWTTDGAYAGTVFYRKGRFNCTNVCGTMQSKINFIDMKFLTYALEQKTKKHVVYCGNPKLMNNVMAQVKIQIPPLPEQKIIAEILTAVDNTIEKSDAVIKKTKQLKKGLMRELLTRGIGHKKFKKTEIGEIPVDWDVCLLKDFTTMITKGTTPTTYGHSYTNEGISFLKIENIDENGKIKKSNLQFISIDTHNFLARSQLKKGDVVFSIAGALGRAAIITDDILPANVNQALAIIRLRETSIDGKFLFYVLNSLSVRTQTNLMAVQLAQANLNLQQVGSIKIPFPKPEEQKKIVAILMSVDEEIDKAVENRAKLNTIKKGLMQVLLTGRVRVEV